MRWRHGNKKIPGRLVLTIVKVTIFWVDLFLLGRRKIALVKTYRNQNIPLVRVNNKGKMILTKPKKFTKVQDVSVFSLLKKPL